MAMPSQPIVFLVDDDLSEHARIRALIPSEIPVLSAYSAVQAIERSRQLRLTHSDRLILLILDYRLPDMDGALLAAKLREILPEAALISLSSLPEIGPLMGISGMSRNLSKRMSDDELREQIAAVLARPDAAPVDPILSPYLANHATTMALLRAERPSLAILASSRPVLQLLTGSLQQAGYTVGAQSTNGLALQAMLPTIPVRALVSDGPAWSRARTLAEPHNVPLLVITMALSTAIGLSIEPVSILVSPEPSELPDVLDTILSGRIYHDRRIAAAYETLELTMAERPVLAYMLRDLPVEQAARELHLSESAVRKARMRAMQRLNAERTDDIRILLDELLIS